MKGGLPTFAAHVKPTRDVDQSGPLSINIFRSGELQSSGRRTAVHCVMQEGLEINGGNQLIDLNDT